MRMKEKKVLGAVIMTAGLVLFSACGAKPAAVKKASEETSVSVAVTSEETTGQQMEAAGEETSTDISAASEAAKDTEKGSDSGTEGSAVQTEASSESASENKRLIKNSEKKDPVVTVYTEQDLADEGLEIYNDFEPHEVVYDKSSGESMQFIRWELPEHGIESIALPAELVENSGELVPITDPDYDLENLEDGVVYDLSPLYYPDCFVIATKNYRFFSTTTRLDKVINLDTAVMPFGTEFVSGDFENNKILVNLSYYTVLEHSDGAKDFLLYKKILNKTISELSDEKGDISIVGGEVEAGCLIRPRGKQVQGVYLAVAKGSPGYGSQKLMEYVLLHSLKFTDKLESTLRYVTEDDFKKVYGKNPNIDFSQVFTEE